MNKKISVTTFLVSILVTAVITFNATFVIMNVGHNKEKGAFLTEHDYISSLLTIEDIVRLNYIGEIEDGAVKDAVIRGFLSGIDDKYAAYLNPSEYDAYLDEFYGSRVGVGITALRDEDKEPILIIDVVPNSPADKAGIEVGDRITAVDGRSVSEIGYDKAVDLIAGDMGTTVNLSLLRDGNELSVTCTRDFFKLYTVKSHVYSADASIGVIKISSFNSDTPADVKKAVEELQTKGCEKFIFDIRGNGGGELNSIVKTLDYILPQGKIAEVHYKNGDNISYSSDTSFLDAPVAVLVNGDTASAAELFAAALRDYTRDGKYDALLVGTNTYGKGVFQTYYTLYDGSAFKFTVGKYDPPCGVNYDGTGVIPDVIEDLSDEAKELGLYRLTDENDNQLILAANRLSAKQ